MAKHKFEGDLENINEYQIQYISNKIIELGFENSKVSLEPVGVAGDNYAACVKRITIEGDNGCLNMIAKIAPSIEMHRQMLNTFVLFRNEHIMYTEVLPKLVQLQKNADVPEEDLLRYAKCYGSFSESPNEVILLEDLKTSNFKMLDRLESISDECVRSVLKNFATLHSLSYVLRYKEPETFSKFKESLTDVWSAMSAMEEMKAYFQGVEDDTLAVLDNSECADLIRHKIADTMNLSTKLSKADKDSKYNVIQQGDAWTNNIMFRFEDDKLQESIMIDYQISKNNSPVADILYMIFNCTDYETRRKHYNDWIDYYHSELEKSLFNYNLKVNYIFPRDKLDADLKRYAKLMFGLCAFLSFMLVRKSADVEKVMEEMKNRDDIMMDQPQQFSILTLDEESINRFKNKIIGLINSFKEFGLL